MNYNRIILPMGIILISSVTLFACQANLFTYRGAAAKPGIRIELKEGGPHTDSWAAHDLSVQYEYVKNRDVLKISGDIALNYRWPVVETFQMRINFLDRDNRIIESRILNTYGYRRILYKLDFQNRFSLPDGAAAIGFSYDGVLRGHGDDGDWSFWLDPRRADKYGFFY